MNAPEDQNGLREALARDIADVLLEGGALSPLAFARRLLRPAGPFASLIAERDSAAQLAYDLKYAAAGGEDVPGSANAVTVEDVARWRDDAWSRTDALDRDVARAEAHARAAEAEITRLKEGMEALKKPAGPVYAAAYDQGRGPDDEDDWMLCDRNGRCIARMLDRYTAEIIAREWNQDLATLSPKEQS